MATPPNSMYILYIRPGVEACDIAVRMLPRGCKVWIQNVDKLPTKPDWLNGIPILAQPRLKQIFRGTECVNEIQRYVEFLYHHPMALAIIPKIDLPMSQEPEYFTESEPYTKSQSEPKLQPKSQLKSEPNSGTKLEPTSQLKSEPKPQPNPGTGSELKSELKSKINAESSSIIQYPKQHISSESSYDSHNIQESQDSQDSQDSQESHESHESHGPQDLNEWPVPVQNFSIFPDLPASAMVPTAIPSRAKKRRKLPLKPKPIVQ